MSRNRSVSVFAPAKINLTLHVTGKRADGYHFLDSLVAFADIGDHLKIELANTPALQIHGPEAGHVPATADNLVMQVASLFGMTGDAAFHLTKNLPVSSGIGGGSADAAAAFRGLTALATGKSHFDPHFDAHRQQLLGLGADIPMCLLSQTARVKGIGEQIMPLEGLPELFAVLVNPRRAVSTPHVFRALVQADNTGMPEQLPEFSEAGDFIAWLATQRNDLQATARCLTPAIEEVLADLSTLTRCGLARMSGSGATCFGLFLSFEAAQAASEDLRKQRPEWWIEAAVLGTQTQCVMPEVS